MIRNRKEIKHHLYKKSKKIYTCSCRFFPPPLPLHLPHPWQKQQQKDLGCESDSYTIDGHASNSSHFPLPLPPSLPGCLVRAREPKLFSVSPSVSLCCLKPSLVESYTNVQVHGKKCTRLADITMRTYKKAWAIKSLVEYCR